MFTQIISMISQSISSSIIWLDNVIGSITGISIAILASFLIYTSIRLLLVPFIGSASSDLATRGVQKKRFDRKQKWLKDNKKNGK